MSILNQLIRHDREEKQLTDLTRALDQCPQKQGKVQNESAQELLQLLQRELLPKKKKEKSGRASPRNARYFSVGDNTPLSFGIDPSSSLRCKVNVREGERRGASMGGMKSISGGMGLSREDANPGDDIGIGLDISSVFEKGFNGDRTPLLLKSNGLGDIDSLDFMASLSLQPATLLVPKIYIIQNPFKRLITKVTKQADDGGSAGSISLTPFFTTPKPEARRAE
ncbi:hypothetical protein HAX54_022393 [Datura stramonium]|uniref:Uncharacterized protein n=1 Tax=Datura stramonium TaxID=4076 RepID=A0ABS8UX79_DATST|nr:hypothetical protein [Datura stramonium]